jgi:hypothetical protein
MDQNFDPYHKWLGIPPHEQPANLYRLLGVSLFEPDLDVIASAADQRMAHLRGFQTGGNAALSQKLLNEVSRARVRLLDFNQKAAYDAELRSAIARISGGAGAAGQNAASVKPASPARPNPGAGTPRRAPNTVGLRRDLPPALRAPENPAYEVGDNESQEAAPVAASVALTSPRAGSGFGAAAPRRAGPRRGNRTLYGIVTGGILGLVIGYLLLTNLNPKADFLGIFPDREEPPAGVMAARGEGDDVKPVNRPPVKRPAKAPIENPETSKVAPPPGSTNKTPINEQPNDAAQAKQPPIEPGKRETAAPKPEKKVDPIALLPQAVSLPKAGDSKPLMLADFDGTDGLKIESVELLTKLADSSAQNLAAQAEPSGKGGQWLIGVAKEGKVSTPLARLKCDETGIQFQWEKQATGSAGAVAAQLHNTLLRLSVAGQQKLIALRKPAPLGTLVLEMTHKETSHRILDAPLPKADTIWLEVVGLERFPVRAKFKSDKSKAPFRKDAMSHVVLAFDKLNNGADSPELQLRLVQTTTGGLDLKIIRVLNTARRGAFDLTRGKVEEVRTTAEGRLRPIELEIPDVTREIQSAQRQFESVKAQPAVGIYNIAYKQQRLNALRAQIKTLTARLTQLNKERAELNGVLKGVPPVESLVSQLDSAKLEVRVFCQSGDLTILLASTADNASGDATASVPAGRASEDPQSPNNDAPLFIGPKRGT